MSWIFFNNGEGWIRLGGKVAKKITVFFLYLPLFYVRLKFEFWILEGKFGSKSTNFTIFLKDQNLTLPPLFLKC